LAGNSQRVCFCEGSIEDLPYESQSFDIVNCLDVLEHTCNPGAVIKEFNRVLKRGGKVFVTAPTRWGEIEQRIHESIEGTMFPAMLHMHHFDPRSLTNLFRQEGFKYINITPFDYIGWEDLRQLAQKSPNTGVAMEIAEKPFEAEALQLFAIYEKC
jgi:2-polyprenyl-6-hydroxyphenyl methylase/3-demethylubiquinone-9 3-methyltransferase